MTTYTTTVQDVLKIPQMLDDYNCLSHEGKAAFIDAMTQITPVSFLDEENWASPAEMFAQTVPINGEDKVGLWVRQKHS